MTESVRSAITIRIGDKAARTILGSAIGGPAWRPDAAFPWPKDRRGVEMMHLVRINFTDMPPLDGFPKTGLLQVFISTEAITLGAEEPHGQGFIIEYWPEYSEGIAVPQPELDEDNFDEETPLVDGEPDDLMHVNGRSLEFKSTQMELDVEPEDRPEMWLGGWPLSVQETAAEEGDIVLLQIGNGEVGEHEFMWGGDIGAATFLISPDDLTNKRFDQVFYDASGY